MEEVEEASKVEEAEKEDVRSREEIEQLRLRDESVHGLTIP